MLEKKEDHIEIGVSIHSYSDTSEVAYGAAVYLTVQYQNGDVSSKLVVAITRVTPLAAVSIPRLEVMAAVLSLHLAHTVTNTRLIRRM